MLLRGSVGHPSVSQPRCPGDPTGRQLSCSSHRQCLTSQPENDLEISGQGPSECIIHSFICSLIHSTIPEPSIYAKKALEKAEGVQEKWGKRAGATGSACLSSQQSCQPPPSALRPSALGKSGHSSPATLRVGRRASCPAVPTGLAKKANSQPTFGLTESGWHGRGSA